MTAENRQPEDLRVKAGIKAPKIKPRREHLLLAALVMPLPTVLLLLLEILPKPLRVPAELSLAASVLLAPGGWILFVKTRATGRQIPSTLRGLVGLAIIFIMVGGLIAGQFALDLSGPSRHPNTLGGQACPVLAASRVAGGWYYVAPTHCGVYWALTAPLLLFFVVALSAGLNLERKSWKPEDPFNWGWLALGLGAWAAFLYVFLPPTLYVLNLK